MVWTGRRGVHLVAPGGPGVVVDRLCASRCLSRKVGLVTRRELLKVAAATTTEARSTRLPLRARVHVSTIKLAAAPLTAHVPVVKSALATVLCMMHKVIPVLRGLPAAQ